MTHKSVSQLTEEEMENFAKSFDTVITFCEGVLGRRDRAISGSPNAVDVLKRCGKRLLYFSRDCSSSRREICENMRKINYELKPNEIVCMTSLMANYLKKRLCDRKIYVIGSSGISEELSDVGLPNFGTGPDVLTTDLATFVHSYKDDPKMGAVVVGFDEHFSYPKMLRAASYLSAKDVLHVACTERTKVTAALVACIETCSDRKALVFDTSASIIADTIVDLHRIVPEKTLIIAPGENDDIRFATFQRFRHFLSVACNDNASLPEASEKLDESSIDSIFRSRDLAELADRLEI